MALDNLSLCYKNGNGVNRDINQARYFEQAAAPEVENDAEIL